MMSTSLPSNIFAVSSRLFSTEFWQRMFHLIENELAIFTNLQTNSALISHMNQEKTTTYCNTMLTLFKHEKFLNQWAQVQYILGEVYRIRVMGERKSNLEHALAYCQQALPLYTCEESLIVWAMIQISSGLLYGELGALMSEPEEVYEQALECYLHAESIFAEEIFPLQWAIVQQGLSFIYTVRIKGDKGINLQQAITRGQSSLRVLTRAAYPLEWAAAHSHLAEAYRQATAYVNLCELYSGRSTMQEQALRHLEAALQIYTIQCCPFEWARVQRFLGMVYLDRIRGERADNLEKAKESFEAALGVFQPEFSPPIFNGPVFP